jgi:hypothetical protein
METLRSNAKRSGTTRAEKRNKQRAFIQAKRSRQEGFGDASSPMGSRGEALAAGSRGVSAHTLGAGPGRGAPGCQTEAPRSLNAKAPRSPFAADIIHGALPVGTTAPYPNPSHSLDRT